MQNKTTITFYGTNKQDCKLTTEYGREYKVNMLASLKDELC